MSSGNKDFFCPLPWVHITFEPNGNIFSCNNSIDFNLLGSLNDKSILENWNNNAIADLRKEFQDEVIPDQCKICVSAENVGRISLREAARRRFPDITKDSVPELRFLGMSFGNVCNLKCRTCGPELSTSWYKDSQELGLKTPNGPMESFSSEENFQKFLSEFPDTIEVLYFTGGEPLLADRFYRLLDYLLENNRQDIHIIINTNGTIRKFKDRDVFKILHQFTHVSIDLSLDGVEKEFEYLRSGASWLEVKSWINDIQKTCPQLILNIYPTISFLNYGHLVKVLETVVLTEMIHPKNVRLNTLFFPEHYSAQLIPEKVKENIRKDLKLFNKKLVAMFDIEDVAALVTQINGVINYASFQHSDDDVNRLLELLASDISRVDKIRNESFLKIFPVFSESMKKYLIN